MNSRQIERILKELRATKKLFLGVFSSDTIPKKGKHYPHCLVANTEKAGSMGEHWVACYVKSAKSIEYFDSLGEQPNSDLSAYLNTFKRIQINKKGIQLPLSDACGHYCIYFLVCRCTGIPYCDVMETLHKTSSLSDYFVKMFVRNLLRI